MVHGSVWSAFSVNGGQPGNLGTVTQYTEHLFSTNLNLFILAYLYHFSTNKCNTPYNDLINEIFDTIAFQFKNA